MKCKLSNYSNERNSMDIIIPDTIKKESGDILLKDLSIDEVIETIKKTTLKGKPFSVSLDSSEDMINYGGSVNELIKTIISKLKEKDLSFKLSANNVRKIENELKKELYPVPLTVAEKEILAVIPEVGLVREEERRKMNLENTLYAIFEGDNVFDRTREELFNDEMLINTIINTNSDFNFGIVDDQLSLNENIMAYQESLYSIIKNFLINAKLTDGKHFSESVMSDTMYYKDPETNSRLITSKYYDTMLIMYNYITKLREDGTLNSMIEDSWGNATIKGKGDHSLYDAICAYINLTYFDDLLKNSFGDYISINDRIDIPVYTETDSEGVSTTTYKYNFTTGNSNNVKVWDQDEDALEKMSNFSKFLIQSIPIYEYKSKEKFTGKLDPKSFINTFTRLIAYGQRVNDNGQNPQFINACRNFYDDIEGNLNIIFNDLFVNPSNLIIESLQTLGFDINNFDYLYSVYRTVFDGENSWKGRELKYLEKNGYKLRYSLVDTLIGVIKSNVSMNYLQSVYDMDSNEIKTEIKSKVVTDKSRFDYIDSLNQNIIEKADRKTLIELYNLESNGTNHTITLNVGETPLTFTIEQTNSKIRGLLDKPNRCNGFLLHNVPDINKLKLNDKSERERLVERENLTDDEKNIMNILDFVDTMLDTKFAKSPDGLRELALTLKLNGNNFRDMIISAARALLITNIYDKFENSVKDNGNKYEKTELKEFLEVHPEVYEYKITRIDPSSQRYFFKKYDFGYLLTTLNGNILWVRDLSIAKAQLSGDSNKSVINNFEGSKIPNYSPTFLGATAKFQFHKSKQSLDTTGHLLFSVNEQAIITEGENTEIKLKNGVSKQVKDMTLVELMHDTILNKFVVPFLKKQQVWIQPTTYSDKTKFTQYLVDLSTLGIDDLESEHYNSKIETMIINTIGRAYRGVCDNVIKDYEKIFPEFVVDRHVDVNQVLNWLKTHNKEDLLERANKANVSIYEELHYRTIYGGNLSVNELLFEYRDTYTDINKLREKLNFEKIKFINALTKNRLRFTIDFNAKGEPDSANSQLIALLDKLTNNASNWVQGGFLIFAKVKRANGKSENIIYQNIELQPGDTVELNPIFDKYFLIDNLIGNNLRLGLTGSEINHPIKYFGKLNLHNMTKEHREFILKYNPYYDSSNTTFYDIKVALDNYKGSEVDAEKFKSLSQLYNEQIYLLQNASQGTQFKRNVSIPGTIRPYLNDRLNGIRDKMKVAVIEDVRDDVFNFDGKSSREKAHDGSAFINPFTSILENKSLQDNEVGTVKKPIHHWFDDRYMTATLLKYAVDTITNQWMRQSEGNDLLENKHAIVLRNIFKKMTNVRWHNPDGTWKFGPIDLIEGCEYRESPIIDFFNDILQGQKLYYTDGKNHYQIKDFGSDEGNYYTIESISDSHGESSDIEVKYYHYFNENGEHLKTTEQIVNPEEKGYHTIDSLFELHTALGGIYSESENKETGNLQYSEASNYAVVLFINNVATKKLGENASVLTQKSYYLPLKEAMIDMLANQTAVKNGTGNINSVSSFYDNTDLKFIEIGTDNYGIQMDADHTADEAKMTEFSQVISSLDAKGRLHDYVNSIYQALGQVAIETAKIELEAIEEFRKTKDKSKVYDIVGRTIINNLSANKGLAGLATAIIKAIRRDLNLNADHELDKLKIPFSDPNIYSTIMSTFVSNLNNKSIKRKYNGLGSVLVPGYDMSMIYDIDGKQYQFEDLIKKALDAGFTSSSTDISKRNKEIVRQYLESKLNEIEIEQDSTHIIPTDNVILHIEGERFLINNLNKREVNYSFWKYGNNDAISIKLKNNSSSEIQVIKNPEIGSFSINIVSDLISPEKLEIFKRNVLSVIPEGATITLTGDITPNKLAIMQSIFLQQGETNNIVASSLLADGTIIPVYKNGINSTYNTNLKEYASLYSIKDYYLFKDNPNEFLKLRGYINISQIGYQKNIISPRNLAPAKISWQYEDANDGSIHYMNIFDALVVKDSFNGKRDKDKIQELFDYLEQGIYFDGTYKHKIVEGTLLNEAAEIIMSPIYLTKFGIKEGDSLADILDKKEAYFKSDPPKPIISDNYDLVFFKNNGKNLYITFKPLEKNDKDFLAYGLDFVYTNYTKFEYPDEIDENGNKVAYKGERNIRYRIYATTKDNIRLFEIGRKVVANNVSYDAKNKVFLDDSGNAVKNLKLYSVDTDGKVLKSIYFITKKEVTEIRNKKKVKFTLYNINSDAISKALYQRNYTLRELTRTNEKGEVVTITPDQKFKMEVSDYIGHLLAKLYESEDFVGVTANTSITKKSQLTIINTLKSFADNVSYNLELSSLLLRTRLAVKNSKADEDDNVLINGNMLEKPLKTYLDKIAVKKYTSFLKSLEFIAARIPAQTLQSFMKMKCVGFTGVKTNQCFVSHWLTWLLGSDYRLYTQIK